VGGTRAFVNSTNGSGDTGGTEYLNMIIVLSEGKVDQINKLYFDDKVVWDRDSSGTLSGNRLQNFEYTAPPDPLPENYEDPTPFGAALNDSNTEIRFWNGDDNQLYDSDFAANAGSSWTSNHRLRGLTYLSLTLKANADAYKGGLPLMTAEIQGRHMQQVSGITTGDTTRSVVNTNADVNPVDVLYDYMTNTRYGKGLDHTSQNATDPDANYQAGLHIDLASFQQARTDIGSYFKINGVVTTSEQLYDNIGEILESMNGVLVFQNGKYRLKIKKQNESVRKTFTYADIVDAVAYQLPGKESKFNKMKAFFRNKETGTDYNDDMVVVDNSTYLTEDNNQILEGQIRLDLVDDETLVNSIATYQMNTSRYNSVINFTAPHNTIKLECGDIIAMQLDDFGWTTGNEKEFRIAQMSLTADDTVEFVCEEYESSIQLIS
jgi:hypothetical protein